MTIEFEKPADVDMYYRAANTYDAWIKAMTSMVMMAGQK